MKSFKTLTHHVSFVITEIIWRLKAKVGQL